MEGMREPESLPPRSVLITFDDGYRTILDSARRSLARFGFPAVLFMPTSFVGGQNAWDANSGEPQEALCTWDELRSLEGAGIAVQSHSVSHPAFSTLAPEELRRELVESKQALASGLGREVSTIAYPYGDPGGDPAVTNRLLIEAGYEAAFLYEGETFTAPAPDRFRIERVPMGPDSDLSAILAL